MVDDRPLIQFEEVLGVFLLRLLNGYLKMQRIKYPFWIFYVNKRFLAMVSTQFMIYKNGFYTGFFPIM